jgi:glucose-6-phosphate dehydrogenase assembly protein OpcA
MSATLWDTNAGEIVKALSTERRSAGAVAFGIVLTLVVVADERYATEAMEAATEGAAAHPCRMLSVIRRQPDRRDARLDAEVTVGGRIGTGEAIVLRCYGRLARHAESVVLPLLAPDSPVATWWYGAPPQKIGQDPLGVLASRRITDCAAASDPLGALRNRALDYSPGDSDLAWTRVTPWRSTLAAAFDSIEARVTSGTVEAEARNPSAALLATWLSDRLGAEVAVGASGGPGITRVAMTLDGSEDHGEGRLELDRPDGVTAVLSVTGAPERRLPLPRRSLGDCIGEELRRLNQDLSYADVLASFAGHTGRSGTRRRS